MTGRRVYFEHAVIGRTMKVTAIDEATGIEVSVVGPANAAQTDLQKLALRKLERKLAGE